MHTYIDCAGWGEGQLYKPLAEGKDYIIAAHVSVKIRQSRK